MELRAAIERAVAADPSASNRSIARALGTHVSTVIRYRQMLAGEMTVDGLLVDRPVPAPLCGCGSAAWRDAGRCLRCGHDLPLVLELVAS